MHNGLQRAVHPRAIMIEKCGGGAESKTDTLIPFAPADFPANVSISQPDACRLRKRKSSELDRLADMRPPPVGYCAACN